jgi:hypothetical protein
MHRIREAMTDTDPTPLGGEGKTVEVDETYQGYVAGGPTWICTPNTAAETTRLRRQAQVFGAGPSTAASALIFALLMGNPSKRRTRL